MNRHRILSVSRSVAVISVVVLAVLAGLPRAMADEPVRLRQLRGEQRAAANKADEEAWPLVRRCQDILVARQRGEEAGDLKKAIEAATAAYADIIVRYYSTEFEARAWQRLIYLHWLAGDEEKSLDAIDVVTSKFAGTRFENETYRSVGLNWLQRRHDPAKALEWFQKVRLPKLPPEPGPDATPKARQASAYARQAALAKYTSTYGMMAKCHIQLGRPAEAVKLFDRIVALWPDQKEPLERELLARVDEVLSGRSQKDVHPALKEWKTSGRKELVPDAEWAKSAYAAVVTPEDRAKALAAKPPLDRLMALLHRHWTKKPSNEELATAIDSVRPQADEAVRRIMDEFNSEGDVLTYRHYAVRALGVLGTPKARDALLDIAIGNSLADLPAYSQSAATRYVALLENKDDARKLLVSTLPAVVIEGLQPLAGRPIDEPLMAQLERLLAFEDAKEPGSELAVRQHTARVMAEDPGEEFAGRKVKAIVAAIPDVALNAKADETLWPGYMTYAEATYHGYATSLATIRGAEEALVAACDGAPADTLRCLMIARGMRGDAAAGGGLTTILADAEAGMFRALAARALREVGTAADVPLLKTVAAADPLARDPGGCMRPPPGQEVKKVFPVREAAAEAVKQIEKRLAEQPY